MNKRLTKEEKKTVKSLVMLGDSARLAIKTVINDRPSAAVKKLQLQTNPYI